MPRVVITVPDQNAQPYRFQLDRELVSLGRGSDNDIVIDSSSVSGKHAELRRVEGGYELANVGSTNGIKLNGERQHTVSLRDGMSLKLGDVTFDFSLTEEEQETLHRESPDGKSPIAKEPAVAAAGPSSVDLLPDRRKPEPVQLREDERRPTRDRQPSGAGFGSIFLFLILAAASFFAGIAIRYQKETGGSLVEVISSRIPSMQAAPAEE